jgi:ketosteroid isomerase-like protein
MEATTEKTTTTTQEVADRFYELAQQGKFDEIQDELYDENVKSVEPAHSNWQNVQGLDKIKEKAKQWQDMTEEMHGGYTGKPQVAGNFFSCLMGMDVTIKGQGRMKMDEIAVYEVRDGKIVLEHFFF